MNYPYYAVQTKEYKTPSNHMDSRFSSDTQRKVIIASSFLYSHSLSALISTLTYANSFKNEKNKVPFEQYISSVGYAKL